MILFNVNVLARPNENFGARVPDPDGMGMWRSLYESSVGRTAVIVDEDVDKELLETWLKINNVKAVVYETVGTTEPRVKAEVVQRMLTAAGGRSMYLDTDAATVAHTLQLGIPSLLVCLPYTIRPEWSVERQIRGWDSLVDEIDKQALARSEKNWGEIE